jgi:hypothetical protein
MKCEADGCLLEATTLYYGGGEANNYCDIHVKDSQDGLLMLIVLGFVLACVPLLVWLKL